MRVKPSVSLDWFLILPLVLIDAGLLLFTPMRLTWGPEAVIFFAALALGGIGLFYGNIRRIPRLAHMGHTGCLVILFTNVAALFNYLAYAVVPLPLWDQRFDALDRALGLNWLGLYNWVAARPWLYTASNVIYGLLGAELVILLLLLEGLDQHQRAVELRSGFFISAIATIIIGVSMPAIGPFAFYHLPVAGLTAYVAQLNALHNGTMRVIDLANAQGLITFPSFHATLAVLCAYAARTIRYLAWPALVLNILIICTAPVIGGHYFTDILAGLVLAAAVIAPLRYAHTRLERAAAPGYSLAGGAGQ
jgi:membrane-associated phospholipid phosphatase